MSKHSILQKLAMVIIAGATLLAAPMKAPAQPFFIGDVTGITGSGDYNGSWTFEVTLVTPPTPGVLNFTVISTDTGINVFNGDVYEIPITSESGGTYAFNGGNDTGVVDTAGLNLTGTFNPGTNALTITSIVSGGLTFKVENIKIAPVPEPATMLLLASGLVGLAGFRRKFRKN